jgi:hypothetical protein
VASSRISIGAFLSNALAIAIRCRCPPLSFTPLADHGLVAFRHPPDELLGQGIACRFSNVLIVASRRP